MLVLGLFVVALIPKDSFQRFNLETAVSKVTEDLHYAQELAQTTNTNCGINFVASGSYTVYQGSTSTPVTNPLTRQAFVYTFSDNFKNVNILNNLQVEFNTVGKPVLGGGQTVGISDGTTTANLLITANTGLVQRQ